MSELRERLTTAAHRALDREGIGTVEDLLEGGRDLIAHHLTGDLEYLRQPAEEGLAALAEAREPAARMTLVGLAWIVASLEDDDEREARRYYISNGGASYQEVRRFQQASGDRAEAIAKDRQDACDALLAKLAGAGKVALKALGIVLLGAIGA